LRDVEIWRLQRQARRNRAIFLRQFLHHLIVAISSWPHSFAKRTDWTSPLGEEMIESGPAVSGVARLSAEN
jgi:hypothetical protein